MPKAMTFGAIGLAGALTAAALVAPNRASSAAPTYVPDGAATIVAHVPARDPQEVAERQALAAAPERVELAVDLARAELERARKLSDPRYLGRAQAILARWWKLSQPPADVLLLRATIEQSLHQFTAARADLDQLIAQRPDDVQAHLTRAVVATVTSDYAAAHDSCAVLAARASPLIAMTCQAPLDALAGDPDGAYRHLVATIGRQAPLAGIRRLRSMWAPPSLRAWVLTTLAELAIQSGNEPIAAEHLRSVLAIDPDDAYARAALADILMPTAPGEASALLAGFESIDNLLVRRAIAENKTHGPDAAKLTKQMRDRIAAAAQRADRVHLREEAMFVLAVDSDPDRALKLARDNWHDQQELADARLLAETAVEAREPDAAAPVIAWVRKTGVRDVRLERWLERLTSMTGERR